MGGGDSEPTDPTGDSGESEVSIPLYCSIAMGDENITTAAFDIGTGEIEIDEVTGPLVIRTWADEH